MDVSTTGSASSFLFLALVCLSTTHLPLSASARHFPRKYGSTSSSAMINNGSSKLSWPLLPWKKSSSSHGSGSGHGFGWTISHNGTDTNIGFGGGVGGGAEAGAFRTCPSIRGLDKLDLYSGRTGWLSDPAPCCQAPKGRLHLAAGLADCVPFADVGVVLVERVGEHMAS